MTKTEFKAEFKRLRVAGYRLPLMDGVTVDDVMDEWYATFAACRVEEFAWAINRLKETKTDTFWPATGELWFAIKEYRKANAIRRSASDHAGAWSMSDADVQDFLTVFRAAKAKILSKMTMPDAEPQTEPQAIADARAIAEEDAEATA